MKKQTTHETADEKEELQQRNRLGTVSRKTTRGLKQFTRSSK